MRRSENSGADGDLHDWPCTVEPEADSSAASDVVKIFGISVKIAGNEGNQEDAHV